MPREQHHSDYPEDGQLRDEAGNTALHLLARHGDAKLFRSVWFGTYAQTNASNEAGQTPLHEAAISGNLSDHRGFGEVISDDTRNTILQLAAEAGHSHIVRWLLKQPIYPRGSEEVPAVENQAVMLAAQNGHEDIVQLLLEFRYATSGQLVHLALKKGWDKVAQLAIWCAAQPVLDWRDPSSNNKTALHIAVELGRVEIINRLLEVGVNANIKDDKGANYRSPSPWRQTTSRS